MTTILLLYVLRDAGYATSLRSALTAQGYLVWQDPQALGLNDPAYPKSLDGAVVSSAAIVLVWSESTGQADVLQKSLLKVQQLKKPLYVILLDSTVPSALLAQATQVASQPPHTDQADVVAKLAALLPAPQSALVRLYEKAAHEYIRVRKEAIDLAAEMLRRSEEQHRVVALLEYLASTNHEMITSIREKAQAVLTAHAQKGPPLLRANDAKYIFGVRCKNGHVTYFDKRRVCNEHKNVYRGPGQKSLVYLNCGQCGEEMEVEVDCEEYR